LRLTKTVAAPLCMVTLACVVACSLAPTPEPLPKPTTAPPTRPRVVILSLDGARDDWVDGYLEDGTMPNLAALAQRGARAEYAQTIDPSMTAAAHVSIATGAYPNHTGQVSDSFHLSRNPIDLYTDGLEEPEMQVEPLWRTAMRNGVTIATVFWPGTRTGAVDRLADYTVGHATRQVHSALHVVETRQAGEWRDVPASYSPPLQATLNITGTNEALVAKLHLLAADSTDDEQENYDVFLLCRERRVDDECATLRDDGLAPLLVWPVWRGVAYFKLRSATPERIEVFQSAVWSSQARPSDLQSNINDKFGFLPPAPDEHGLERGWITAHDYWDMAERRTRWLAQVITYVFTAYQPDLTFAWFGVTQECGRSFLMVDERQRDYSEETAQAYAEYVRKAYALADECLGDILPALVLGRDNIFVVSDHGMAPVHSQVDVSTILEQAGLLQYSEGSDFPVDTANSRAVAVASGGAVNVYINLEGREQPGIVPHADYESVQAEIIQALQSATDADSEPLFDRVLRREELSTLHLDSPNSGDVFAQAALGYALTDWRGTPEVVEPAPLYGHQGYDSTRPEMHAILIAAGRGIRTGVRLPAVHLLDVVPTVASLLRVTPVEAAEGRVLAEMLEERR
jgi:predicted AlkP superfamily phosphohydrolase/phosphomutase